MFEYLAQNEKQMIELKKLLDKANMNTRSYLRQWFLRINIKYIKTSKQQRKKNIMDILYMICDYSAYDERVQLKQKVLEVSKGVNCPFNEIELEEYPDDYEW